MAGGSIFLLEAHGVSKAFMGRRVLDGVSLSVGEEDIITVIGLNGSGKSTLLRILLGLESADSGEVRRRAGLRVGYMPQKITIDPVMPLTVGWFLKLNAGKRALADICEEVGITPLLQSDLHSLSGGELQRVMLARALLCDPHLLVLDEPVQGVDITGQAQLYDLISGISRRHRCAVLMVSHDLHLVMASTSQVICLNHHICCQGHPHQVSRDPAFAMLFGQRVAESLAVYTHHHDHVHELSGEVCNDPTHKH